MTCFFPILSLQPSPRSTVLTQCTPPPTLQNQHPCAFTAISHDAHGNPLSQCESSPPSQYPEGGESALPRVHFYL